MTEVNALAGTLREQRLGALEATALLRKVMEEIDVAVFTFDEQERLRLVNRAGERAPRPAIGASSWDARPESSASPRPWTARRRGSST